MSVFWRSVGFLFRRLRPGVRTKIAHGLLNYYRAPDAPQLSSIRYVTPAVPRSSSIRLSSGRELHFDASKGAKRFTQLEGDLTYLMHCEDNDGQPPLAATKEPETVRWINSFPEGIVFWDIGANCGSYSLYAALEKNCRVLAFEPAFSNYDALNTNIQLNSADDRVSAYCLAFHDKKSITGLQMQRTKAGGSGSSFESPVDHKGELFAPCFIQGALGISIDAFIEEYRADIPNAMKIDVDGNEDRILEGAVGTLKNSELRWLSVELNDARTDYVRMVTALLNASGFSLVNKTIASKKRTNDVGWDSSPDRTCNYHFEKRK